MAIRGTKTEGSAASVPLLPLALDELARWHKEQGAPAAGVLFKNELTGKPYADLDSHVPFRKALETAVAKSNLKKRITPYTLRHTAATLLVELGVSSHSVAKMLRHTNPRMLERTYDHSGVTRSPDLLAKGAALKLPG